MHTADRGVKSLSVLALVRSPLRRILTCAALQTATTSADRGFAALLPGKDALTATRSKLINVDTVVIPPPIARAVVNQLSALAPQMLELVATMELADLLLEIRNVPVGSAARLPATVVPQRIIARILVASISSVLAIPITPLPEQAR